MGKRRGSMRDLDVAIFELAKAIRRVDRLSTYKIRFSDSMRVALILAAKREEAEKFK